MKVVRIYVFNEKGTRFWHMRYEGEDGFEVIGLPNSCIGKQNKDMIVSKLQAEHNCEVVKIKDQFEYYDVRIRLIRR